MPNFTLSESEDVEYETIPDETVLEAEVVEVKEQDSFFWNDKDDHSQGKQREISFRFKVTEEGQFNNRTVFGSTPTWFTTSSRCKFRVWVQEILGVDELPVDFIINTDALVGEPVKVILGTYPKKDGTEGNRVVDLARATSGNWQEPF